MLARSRTLAVALLAALAIACSAAGAFAAATTPVQVKLKLEGTNTLRATVTSSKKKCTKNRLVEFFQKSLTPGDTYSQIGAEYTDGQGKYTSGLLGEGRFYVKVRPETKQGTKCGGGRSAVVKIKLE